MESCGNSGKRLLLSPFPAVPGLTFVLPCGHDANIPTYKESEPYAALDVKTPDDCESSRVPIGLCLPPRQGKDLRPTNTRIVGPLRKPRQCPANQFDGRAFLRLCSGGNHGKTPA